MGVAFVGVVVDVVVDVIPAPLLLLIRGVGGEGELRVGILEPIMLRLGIVVVVVVVLVVAVDRILGGGELNRSPFSLAVESPALKSLLFTRLRGVVVVVVEFELVGKRVEEAEGEGERFLLGEGILLLGTPQAISPS